jgi:hypothetical protein
MAVPMATAPMAHSTAVPMVPVLYELSGRLALNAHQ